MSVVISTSNLLAFSLFLDAFLMRFCALKPLPQPATTSCESLIKFWTSSL